MGDLEVIELQAYTYPVTKVIVDDQRRSTYERFLEALHIFGMGL